MLVCDKCEETSVTLEGYEPTGFYRMYDTNGAEVVVCELCREEIEDE